MSLTRGSSITTTRAVTVESVVESPVPPSMQLGRNAEGNERLITIKFRNTSGRPITAIAIDVEDLKGASRDMIRSVRPLQPGDITEFQVRNKLGGDSFRRLRVKAVLFADKGADEGDPATAHVIRFRRLGSLLEENRCLAMVNRLDPSTLDGGSVAALLASVKAEPRSLDEALASLPEDPNLKFASHARIRGAGADAQECLLVRSGLLALRVQQEGASSGPRWRTRD